ncbi:MAG: hypothetical protein V1754_00855 [Pseudomonadota bacterium]
MKNPRRREDSMGVKKVYAVTAIAVILLAVAGCVDERSFYISRNLIPTDTCEYPASEDIFRGSGVLDVSEGLGYWLFPRLHSKLQSSAGKDGQPERNNLFLREIEVELDLGPLPPPAGTNEFSLELTKFTIPVSGVITPGGNVSMSVEIVPDSLVKVIGMPPGTEATIYATVSVMAEHNGRRVDSSAFLYPIELCNGCLVQRPKDNVCPYRDDIPATYNNPCELTQDQHVICCVTEAGIATCDRNNFPAKNSGTL